jgi:hypothetical protein
MKPSNSKERAPGPDGINVAFYLTHWALLEDEFKSMIDLAICNNACL